MPKTYLNPLYPPKKSAYNQSPQTSWGQLRGCAQDLLIANTAREYKGLIVLVTPDSHSAYTAEANIKFFSGLENIHIFPDWETLPYDVFSPHEDLISERLKTLYTLNSLKQGVLIVPVSTLMLQLPPVDYIRANTLIVKVGDTLDIAELRIQLNEAGYRH
ncbi:MAG: transcription-repair coupling factor, partial [Cocleimonas sp.]